jgi:hypothetical protein
MSVRLIFPHWFRNMTQRASSVTPFYGHRNNPSLKLELEALRQV